MPTDRTGGTIRVHKGQRSYVNTSDYSFAKYAATYFYSTANGYFNKQPLKKPLLQHDSSMDDIAAQAIWIMILRFMGDMPEPNYEHIAENSLLNDIVNPFVTSKRSMMHHLTRTLSNNSTQNWNNEDVIGSPLAETEHQRLIRRTLKRKSKLPEQIRRNDGIELEYYNQVLKTRCSNLDKLHFIIGHGILRPTIRDEILAQICKQLIQNPNRTSFVKGWILLSLCIGCFPPSPHFCTYFRCFLRNGPELFTPYCEDLLERTLKNGARSQPPSWLELEAIRTRNPITLKIFLMDSNVKKIQIDSASTAEEVVNQLSENIGLKDSFGFTIVIGLYDKIMSLGSGQQHILDAISSCEQYAKEQGQNDRIPPWKLYLRKEMFTTWYNPAKDRLATQLIYKQILRGLNYGEYRCRSETDITMISALAYYAEHGATMDLETLRKQLPELIPKDLLIAGERALANWAALILTVFKNLDYVHHFAPQQHAKEDICMFAKMSWPMSFSRFFEAVRIGGPRLINNNVTIAINSNGVYFIDETEQVLAEISYVDIDTVYVEYAKWKHINELHIDTVQNENFTFNCKEGHDVTELIQYMIRNLKLRSKYGVAMRNYNPIGEKRSTQLYLHCGDLIKFDTQVTGAMVLENTNRWLVGVSNCKRGEFSAEIVKVLATMEKPSSKTEQTYKKYAKSDGIKHNLSSKYNTIQRKRMHTLEKFAAKYFRPSAVSPVTPNATGEKLWQHSRNVLEAPLLKSLQHSEEEFIAALQMYCSIMMYMGDIPTTSQTDNSMDLIFQPALEFEQLRNELFCQLMKQLTDNRAPESEEAAWDLMYLACGITYPDSLVMRELDAFLRTRPHSLANHCLKRIKRTMTHGHRQYPPHAIEVKAIQQRCLHIYHKIYFPDKTVGTFEISSSTHGLDLENAILDYLGVKNRKGYSLFIKIGDKAFSIPEEKLIFDFISEALEWIQQIMITYGINDLFDGEYLLYFMKKLWLERIQPAQDISADVIFHYPQEELKYLNDYYKIDKDLAVKLAALSYLANYGHSSSYLQNTNDILLRILPENIIHLTNAHDWKIHIIKELKLLIDENITDVVAKVKFLEHLGKQDMFGSTFFLVNQESDLDLPEILLIAINRFGFHIIHSENKEVLRTYKYIELSHRTAGKTFFHIRFGNMIGASKLHCNTNDGYKIDDLISSYIKHLK